MARRHVRGLPAVADTVTAAPRPVPAPPGPLVAPGPSEEAFFVYATAADRVTWSAAFGALLDRPPAPDGLTRRLMARLVHRDDRTRALRAATQVLRRCEPMHLTLRLIRSEGGWCDVDCQLDPLLDTDGTATGVRGSVRDVSARERARREVARLARRGETVRPSLVERDPGTGLLTRARFVDEVDRAVRRGGGAVLVLRVEPDARADSRGAELRSVESHGAGWRPELPAELLHRAARVLESVARPDDLIGQVGPAEIGILLAGTSWPLARRQAELFVEALGAHPFVFPEAWLRARAWAGLVRYRPDAEASSHDLLIDAEQACRQARDAGRSITAIGHPVPALQRQGSYRAQVADALDTDRFSLFSQPILELQSNTVTRHEVLLRVLDEHDRPQSPVQVLDTAERLDAVFDIDLWVVEQALRAASERGDLCLQVNLSGRTVGDPRLSAAVERLIERFAVNPEQITFEITETALIRNLSEARRFADRVRDLGCQLALDDFGSGYASFRYLRLFPIDLVKIDGEYVVDLVTNAQDQVLVRALVEVCQAYGIHTVAEYVQDQPTLALLRDFGVDYAQGYLIGRPESVDVLRTAQPTPPTRLRRSGAGG